MSRGETPKRNGILLLTAATLLVLAFIGYRAKSFHYCAGIGDRPEARVVSGAEPCRPDEEPLEWRRLGGFYKMKLAGLTVAKAFRDK